MAKSVLDIIIRTVKEGGADKETVKGLVSLKNTIQQTAMAGAALAATGYAMKKAFDFAKEGAALEFTKSKFDNLAASIGTTSEALLGDLKTATKGLYSDMDLIASATNLVGLGLANTHDEAVRLATVSAGLNMDMNQLVLTLTNMTTMRFDALGVRVDGFKEKVKALEEQGYSTDAAFKEAFLRQAEAQLKLVGEAADSATGEFMKFEAQMENLTNSSKMMAARGLGPLVEGLNISIGLMERQREIMETTDVTYSRAALNMAAVEAAQAKTNETFTAEQEAAWAAADAVAAHGDALMEMTESTTIANAALTETVLNYGEILQMTESISDRDKEYGDSVAAVTADTSLSVDERAAKLAELEEKYAETTNKIIADSMLQKAAIDGLTQAEFEKVVKFQEATGLLTKTAADQAIAFDQITTAAADGRLTVEGMQAAINALQDKSVTLTVTQIIQNVVLGEVAKSAIGGNTRPDQIFGGGLAGSGRAEGTKGWETVPAGFPNDSYPIMLTSGEKFAVIPPSGSNPTLTGGGMGGGDTYINLTIASPMTILDEQTAKKTLLPFIVNGVREAQARGVLK